MAVTLIKESKNLKEELTNFTIEYYDKSTPLYETDDIDIEATSGKEALAKFKKSHPDAKIYMMYDESDIFYDTETGEEDEEETRRQNQSDYPEAPEGYEEESLKESAFEYPSEVYILDATPDEDLIVYSDDSLSDDSAVKAFTDSEGTEDCCKFLRSNPGQLFYVDVPEIGSMDSEDFLSEYGIEESCKLKEALGDDERVKQVSFDIVVPEDADLDSQEFYEAINEFVGSLNYKLTGTVNVEDLTDDYKSQGYEI